MAIIENTYCINEISTYFCKFVVLTNYTEEAQLFIWALPVTLLSMF